MKGFSEKAEFVTPQIQIIYYTASDIVSVSVEGQSLGFCGNPDVFGISNS